MSRVALLCIIRPSVLYILNQEVERKHSVHVSEVVYIWIGDGMFCAMIKWLDNIGPNELQWALLVPLVVKGS